jgi:hypothetical protein
VPYAQPEPLNRRHLLDAFECGEVALDDWLKKYARAAQGSGSARVYVTTNDGKTVVGYYVSSFGCYSESLTKLTARIAAVAGLEAALGAPNDGAHRAAFSGFGRGAICSLIHG